MRAFEGELAARDLQPLDEIGGAGEQHAPAVLDEREADGCRQMALAAAGRAEQQQIGALVQPAIAGGERHDLRLADHRHGLEVEGVEGLAGGQPGFGEMALDAAAAALGDLVLGERGEEAGGGPAFLVGLLGELGPHQLDGGQAQLGEQQLDAGGVDRIGRRHATTSIGARSASTARTAASSS